MAVTPNVSPSYSILLRVEFPSVAGFLGRILTAIGKTGAKVDAVDIVSLKNGRRTRDICVYCSSPDHAAAVVKKVSAISGLKVLDVSDRTFMLHKGGKIEVTNRVPMNDRDALAMLYTPGVARVSMAVHDDLEKAYSLTMKGRTVAIVTDGTAVLGLGDIGPEGGLPVMEGKAMLFKSFGGVDAFPICLATKKVDEIVAVVKAIAPGFGGINLEDISAPRCFEIEERLIKELDIPVFHDDQHGTAVVVFAALTNALKIVGKDLRKIHFVVNGIGAAGMATTRLLMQCGCRHIIGCDTAGAIYAGRKENMNPTKEWFAQRTNPQRLKGSLKQALKGADVFLGVSGPNLLKRQDIRTMAKDPIIFALANPTPEILPEEAGKVARIMATGRSDYPNQINNVLCFPGLFRGALDCGATKITLKMKLAAARAIAGLVPAAELNEEYIIPSVFNPLVGPAVAAAVARAAREEGVIRPTWRPDATLRELTGKR